MLELVTSKSEIDSCQKLLQKVLKEKLTSKQKFTIGYHSGSMRSQVYFNANIWFSHTVVHSTDQRHWNAFGLRDQLSSSKSNSIIVEINILKNGTNGRVAGAFAKNEKTGAIHLVHTGKVGGGRKGIGKDSFLSWYKSTQNIKSSSSKREHRAVVIGDISSKSFIQKLTKFVKNVALYKTLVSNNEINEATLLSDKDLEERALQTSSNKRPKKKTSTTTVIDRNTYVAEFAKRLAKGSCQLCNKKAPFDNKSGQPYLETHHIVWLSKGGMDNLNNTVALCPNCHRKMHILNSKTDVSTLKNKTKTLTRNSSSCAQRTGPV